MAVVHVVHRHIYIRLAKHSLHCHRIGKDDNISIGAGEGSTQRRQGNADNLVAVAGAVIALACWRRLARSQSVMAMPGKCNRTVGLRRWRRGAGKRNGSISAGPVPSFCGKVFTNGRVTPSRTRCGHEATTSNNAARDRTTMQRCERWLSNGFAWYFVVGKTELPMMRTSIWPRSPGAALPWLPSSQQRKPSEILVDTQWTVRRGDRKNLRKILDRLTQMSEASQSRVRVTAIRTQFVRLA
jgi:hypothetical protein